MQMPRENAKLMLRALLLALLLCFSLACVAREASEVRVEGLLNAANPTCAYEINVEHDGEAVVTLAAYGPGTSWDKVGAEAAVLSVHVDDVYKSDVVLFSGATSHDYQVLLGPLSKGHHRLEFRYEPRKGVLQAQKVRLEDYSLRVYGPDDPLYEVIRHAPIIYGRKEAYRTDVPLLMYHERWTKDSHTVIQYTVIFSNEDGGTPPEGLMARWGRLTDIEWAYRVELDKAGEVAREQYQGRDHKAFEFRGEKEGRHPLLCIATRNNLFSDQGRSPYRFALVPEASLPEGHSREELMDLNPWTYKVMAQEWSREGMEEKGDPDTAWVSDPRNYVYVEFNAEGTARIAVSVKLQGDPTWYSSDHGVAKLRARSRGWQRSAIEVPSGKTCQDIEAVRFTAYAEKKSSLPYSLTLHDVSKVFMLNEDFTPTPSVLEWHDKLFLDTDPDTPDPDRVTFKVES